MRININLAENLIADMDKRAEKFHISRSSYIALCVSRQMQMDDVSENLPTFVDLARKLKDVDFKNISDIAESVKS